MTPNVMFALFFNYNPPCPQHLLEYGFGLAFNAPCATVTDPHM